MHGGDDRVALGRRGEEPRVELLQADQPLVAQQVQRGVEVVPFQRDQKLGAGQQQPLVAGIFDRPQQVVGQEHPFPLLAAGVADFQRPGLPVAYGGIRPVRALLTAGETRQARRGTVFHHV